MFAELLVHTKGDWARRPFILARWQREDIIRPLFGTVEYDTHLRRWVRQYRTAWVELGRKNGKSELLAGVALVLLCADDEAGAEVYGCARDVAQARKVYDVAERMVELSPILSKRLKIYKQAKRIVDPKTASYYEVVPADAVGNLGANPHGVIFDEVLTQPNRELWDAFATSFGARAQPLMVAATTAGDDTVGLCASEHAHSARVAAAPHLDRRRFVYMRNSPIDVNWADERTWKQANPALGTFLQRSALRDEMRAAKLSPEKLRSFLQFRLNVWLPAEALSAWITTAAWDRSGGMVAEANLAGRRAYGGLDLATTTDLAALAWDFPGVDGTHEVIWRFWVPEARRPSLDARTGGLASVWARQGFLTFTEGDVIDYRAITATIDVDARVFDVAEVAYDRWGMTQMSQDLAEAGMVVVPFNQGYAAMSPPTKALEELVLGGKYRHGGNPVASWMIGNVRLRRDPMGNIRPDKARSADKIDGAVAAIMALARAQVAVPPRRSAYEDHGLTVAGR